MRTVLLAGLALAVGFAGSTASAASRFNVIELSYVSRFGKEMTLHFAAPGGLTMKACKASLADAIAEYGPDVNKAFKKNYGTELSQFARATFIKGSCQAFDLPPGQLLKLKTSGQ